MATHNPDAPPRELEATPKRLWRRTVEWLKTRRYDREIHLAMVAEYVEWMRLATFHLEEAEGDPYYTNDEGRAFKHPGFAAHREARREARAVMRDLRDTSAPDDELPPPPDPGDGESDDLDDLGL